MKPQERTRAVLDSQIAPARRLILIVLADYMSEGRETAWPSVETIARRTGYCERQVRTLLGEMREEGLIAQVALERKTAVLAIRWDALAAAPAPEDKRGGVRVKGAKTAPTDPAVFAGATRQPLPVLNRQSLPPMGAVSAPDPAVFATDCGKDCTRRDQEADQEPISEPTTRARETHDLTLTPPPTPEAPWPASSLAPAAGPASTRSTAGPSPITPAAGPSSSPPTADSSTTSLMPMGSPADAPGAGCGPFLIEPDPDLDLSPEVVWPEWTDDRPPDLAPPTITAEELATFLGQESLDALDPHTGGGDGLDRPAPAGPPDPSGLREDPRDVRPEDGGGLDVLPVPPGPVGGVPEARDRAALAAAALARLPGRRPAGGVKPTPRPRPTFAPEALQAPEEAPIAAPPPQEPPPPASAPPIASQAPGEPDTSPVRYRGREVPGDLPAFMSRWPGGGMGLVGEWARNGTVLTTRNLLAIPEAELCYLPKIGKIRAPALADYIRSHGVPPGCLAPTYEAPDDVGVWEQALDGGRPPPTDLLPHQAAALRRVGGVTAIRRAFVGLLPQLRRQFLTYCREAS